MQRLEVLICSYHFPFGVRHPANRVLPSGNVKVVEIASCMVWWAPKYGELTVVAL